MLPDPFRGQSKYVYTYTFTYMLICIFIYFGNNKFIPISNSSPTPLNISSFLPFHVCTSYLKVKNLVPIIFNIYSLICSGLCSCSFRTPSPPPVCERLPHLAWAIASCIRLLPSQSSIGNLLQHVQTVIPSCPHSMPPYPSRTPNSGL